MRRAAALAALSVLSACSLRTDDGGDVKPVPIPKPSTIPATTVELDVLPSLELRSERVPPPWVSASARSSLPKASPR